MHQLKRSLMQRRQVGIDMLALLNDVPQISCVNAVTHTVAIRIPTFATSRQQTLPGNQACLRLSILAFNNP